MTVFRTLSVVLLLIATADAADRRIAAVRVTPATSFEPATVLLQVTVERHVDNRLLTVIVDSGEFYWSSERELEGENAPYLSVFKCKELPAGEYDVQVAIVGSDGKVRATASNRIVVVGRMQ